VAVAFPGNAREVVPAATAAGANVKKGAVDVETAAGFAAAAAGAFEFGGLASTSAKNAVEVAARAGRVSFEDTLRALAADADLLEEKISPVTLALSSKLWSSMPDQMFVGWAELERALLDANEDWEVWTDWYEARLKAGGADRVLEVARATIPGEMWEQGPKIVNAQIRSWLEERGIWRYAIADDTRDEPQTSGAAEHDDLSRRLAGLSLEEIRIVGLRAALRAIPLLTLLGPDLGANSAFASEVLFAFRAVASAWAAAKYSSSDARKNLVRTLTPIRPSKRSSIASTIAAATTASVVSYKSDAVPDVVADAAKVLRSVSAEAAGPAAGPVFDLACNADLNDLQGVPEDAVLDLPLWPGGAPPGWMLQRLEILKEDLIVPGHGWEVWLNWYEDRLAGVVRSPDRERAYAEVPKELWADGPAKVNTWILKRIEELHAGGQSNSPAAISGTLHPISIELTPDTTAPSIPEQRPAAVEPVWLNGRLTLPKAPAKSDLKGQSFIAALKSLRAELLALAEDIAGEANIDRRFTAHVRQLAEQVPQKTPGQAAVFRLGHAATVFAGYSKTVDEQWPDFLAVRYHSVVLHFDRTVQQSPLWREFKRNAARSILTPQQVSEAFSLGTEAAEALQSDGARDFVDPIISQTLQQLARPLRPLMKASNEPEPERDVIEGGKELLAYDVVESLNNTLKRIAEEALDASVIAGSAARNIGSTLNEAGKGYVSGIGKGFTRAAKRQGPRDGEKLFKWLRRAVIAAGGTAAGAAMGLPQLIAMYPQAFAWLEALTRFIR
jgi:hypothetical protein